MFALPQNRYQYLWTPSLHLWCRRNEHLQGFLVGEKLVLPGGQLIIGAQVGIKFLPGQGSEGRAGLLQAG